MNGWNNNPLIKRYEEFANLSPHNDKSKFAKFCGISRSLMSLYLSNKAIVSSNSLIKICKALKCKENDVIERNSTDD